ncbi:LEAF RUST 10 DISEASE-RESISTANCE LOCUS RECEPTOR-LIKE PROTEIN KINASE-like 1.2 isoform X3 [Hevea brasiliensis]|uniref:LEAF RUST 10 DISEASE-RESISTANCE LOCUS RECEPTOR-LIKE PROTEIN KINASE-like 1.2 isoform X3 n=1 Tax=Hevea brasiliensis TaxID=3981 RepID=UPI0025FBB2AC|nr:LEAF RUST 10 DISEASE-RESISTANCE LOCUS RECEPTOR-LIKE PROTEIN KINASE-like 1.2 isoform X3 [Hevea brasiliensis]
MGPLYFFISHKPLLICFIVFFFFFTTLAEESLSADQKFQACAPTSCGKGPNISYPFLLSNVQESFCGYPHFNITCKQEYPVLRISSDDYIIKDIFYNNQSFLVASALVYEEDTCPIPLHNVTLDLAPFNISPGYIDFSFLYNCTSEPANYPIYPISCATNSTVSSFAGFHIEELELYYSYSLNSCNYFVNAPLHTGSDVYSLYNKDYTEILKLGFLLNWTAHNCSTCERSGGRCGFENHEFVCFCHDQTHLNSCDDGDGMNVGMKVGIGVGSAFAGGAIMCLIFYIYIRRRKRKPNAPSSFVSRSITSDFASKSDIERGGLYFGVPVFTYAELEEATKNFDSAKELGDGGFGTVYYGKLRDGRAVAVKRLYENNYKRVEQFMNEVEILTRLRHPHLVSLYGCTSRHSRELLLVYEYIPNGTVADHLHGQRAKPGALPWKTRMKISVETANALAYLHASDIIHRDVKTNNILLDNTFCVKVADFGLSRLFPLDVTHVSTAPQGTPGYVDPEYHECYQLTDKSDVYSFGVVLIELISSMPAVDITRHRHEINLSNMAINKIQSDALHELVDRNLGFESDNATRIMITAVAELAFQCLQGAKEMRPSMENVLETLKEIQSKGYNIGKKIQEIDIQSDDVGLLKSCQLPRSPDTVMTQWTSSSTTSNNSS